MLHVLTIFVRAGTSTYPQAEQEIAEIFARRVPDVQRSVLVVDNALPPEHIEEGSNRWVIGGDNSAWEFSAIDKGLDFIGKKLLDFDLVHVATSAFNTLYVSYLERLDSTMLAAVAARNACLGHIDCYNEPIRILDCHSQHWLRTSFLFLQPMELKLLGHVTTIRSGADFFSGDPDRPFRADAPISEEYQQYIVSWLTGGDIGQGVTWHRPFRLDRKSLAEFEGKTLAIMNEHLFSIRLRAQGCRVTDVTWLSTVLKDHESEHLQWDTDWRSQLANRDEDALVVGSVPTSVRSQDGATSK